MKALWILAFLGMINAFPAQAQTFGPSFIGPEGQKKIGQYVWVWTTRHIPKDHGVFIEADCPIGYVVLSGGYGQTVTLPVAESMPNAAFDSWVVEAFASYSGPNKVTVYASCAPKSSD